MGGAQFIIFHYASGKWSFLSLDVGVPILYITVSLISNGFIILEFGTKILNSQYLHVLKMGIQSQLPFLLHRSDWK